MPAYNPTFQDICFAPRDVLNFDVYHASLLGAEEVTLGTLSATLEDMSESLIAEAIFLCF